MAVVNSRNGDLKPIARLDLPFPPLFFFFPRAFGNSTTTSPTKLASSALLLARMPAWVNALRLIPVGSAGDPQVQVEPEEFPHARWHRRPGTPAHRGKGGMYYCFSSSAVRLHGGVSCFGLRVGTIKQMPQQLRKRSVRVGVA